MAVSTSFAGKATRAVPTRITKIEVPRELIEALAYEKFQQRGGVIGHDWADWFDAEKELNVLFRSVQWAAEHGDNPPYVMLRAVGSPHAIRSLCRYFQWRPNARSVVDGQSARFRVVRPDDSFQIQGGSTMKLDQINNATPEQLERATAARSPVSLLSDQDFARLKGQIVALVLDGPDKGKVIATAPLDQDHPEKPRRSIKEQVAASPYNRRRYQLRQMLEETS